MSLPCPARSFSLVLSKNARSRFGEDAVVSKLVVKAVAESMGVGTQVRCWRVATWAGKGQESAGPGSAGLGWSGCLLRIPRLTPCKQACYNMGFRYAKFETPCLCCSCWTLG